MQGDPLIYRVASVEQASGEGQLHYGVGTLMPGRVGSEYYMTKGHFHARRQAAELYIGLHGEGALLLEAEDGQASTLIPLVANRAIYVPGSTAHRTVNTGRVPLVYLGVYPADAGHDYGAVASRNFRSVVEVDGEATQMDRGTYIASLTPGHR